MVATLPEGDVPVSALPSGPRHFVPPLVRGSLEAPQQVGTTLLALQPPTRRKGGGKSPSCIRGSLSLDLATISTPCGD